jgi:tRNA-Thr(GGU) m(6)t(6)A37 methyltransferase TsaA
MSTDKLTLHPIGIIHTPFNDRYRAPRQPGAESETAEGRIVLYPGKNFEQALEDLFGFEKIWIIFWFHQNKTWKPKVLPPRGPRKRRGVFATRSPHRPNPIGLSLATLLEIKGRTVRVADTDLLDGTPILDLKPYLPYAEAFPNARAGWVDEIQQAERETGSLINWSPPAASQLAWLKKEYDIELQNLAARVLSRDPSPHPYRRIAERGSGILELSIKSWRILFSVSEKCVTVLRVASGYTKLAVKSGRASHDADAHVAFHAKWPDAE